MSVLSSPKARQSADGRLDESLSEDRDPRIKAASRFGRLLDKQFRRLVFRRLENLTDGRLAVIDGNETHLFGSPDTTAPTIELEVLNSHFYRRLALGGSFDEVP